MGYIDGNLGDGEQVVFRTKLHAAVIVFPIRGDQPAPPHEAGLPPPKGPGHPVGAGRGDAGHAERAGQKTRAWHRRRARDGRQRDFLFLTQ